MAKKQRITPGGNTLTKEAPETGEAKVSRIKSAVKKGSYSVDSREVAKALIKHTTDRRKITE